MRELTYLYSFGIILNQKVLHNILAFSWQKMAMTAFSCQAHGVLQRGTGKGEWVVLQGYFESQLGRTDSKWHEDRLKKGK